MCCCHQSQNYDASTSHETQQTSTCLALLPIIPLHPVVARTTLHLEHLNHSCCRRRPSTTDSGMEEELDARLVSELQPRLKPPRCFSVASLTADRKQRFSSSHLIPRSLFFCPRFYFSGPVVTRPAGEITSHLLVRTTFCHICQGDKGVKNRRFPPFFSLNCTYLLSLVNYGFCLWHLSRSDLLCSQSSSTEHPGTPCDLWVESIHEALINKTEGVCLCDRWIIPAV